MIAPSIFLPGTLRIVSLRQDEMGGKGCYEHGDEHSGSLKFGEFLD